jgi:hypothetical protein
MAALGLGIVILISRRKELGLKMSDHRPKIINSVQFSSLAQSCPTLCILSDSKSEEWEKIENVNLESCNQIFKEIGKTQDLVKFTCI